MTGKETLTQKENRLAIKAQIESVSDFSRFIGGTYLFESYHQYFLF